MAPERFPASRCREGGFNFIEVLFVVGMFVVIGAVLLTVLMSGQTSYLAADVHLQVQEEARKALDQTVRELREAVLISCGQALPLTSCGPSPRLNFQLNRYNAGIITQGSEVAEGEFVHYLLLNGNLIRYRDSARGDPNMTDACVPPTCRVIARNVQTADFTWDSTTRTMTIALETLIRNPLLPGAAQIGEGIRSGRLASQLRVRQSDP